MERYPASYGKQPPYPPQRTLCITENTLRPTPGAEAIISGCGPESRGGMKFILGGHAIHAHRAYKKCPLEINFTASGCKVYLQWTLATISGGDSQRSLSDVHLLCPYARTSQSLMVRCSASKLMPTLTTGRPHMAKRDGYSLRSI